MSDIKSYRIILLGNGAVGKTTYTERLLNNKFEWTYNATVGIVEKTVVISTTNGNIRLILCDCPGQDLYYPDDRLVLYRNADACIIMFDYVTKISFMNTRKWYDEISQNVDEPIPIILVGNRIDFLDIKVSHGEILNELDRREYADFCSVSAKTGFNIETPILNISGD